MPSGEVLFSRGNQDTDSTNDEWDDTELVKMYDKSVASLKQKAAERAGMNVDEPLSTTESCTSVKSLQNSTSRKSKNKGKKKKKKQQKREWAVGDHCQAAYSVDGLMYEATIISINHERGLCHIQYVGYGNEDDVALSSLKVSMGTDVRRNQIKMAKSEQNLDLESDNDTETLSDCLHETKGNGGRQKKFSESKPSPQRSPFSLPHGPPPIGVNLGMPSYSGLNHMAFHDMVAPPPPPHIMASLPTEESEALSAMLMSWYMSGFHTGYYQGLKRGSVGPPPHTNGARQ